MSKPKKKPKQYESAAHVFEEHTHLGTLPAAVAEYTRECSESDIEAFEAYSHRLQFHIHNHLKDFSERVEKGYSTLLEVLQQQK